MKSAVVLVSGGLDSATVLAMAVAEGWRCHALSVDYGQRHRAELDAAAQVARSLGAVDHRVSRVDLFQSTRRSRLQSRSPRRYRRLTRPG